MDERSPGSGGRRSSGFPASRLFLSSAYQRRLRFHPQAGSSSILSMNLKSYNMFFFKKKKILHDWSDPYCTKILTELRKAAREDTKLLVVDNIVAPVCHDPTFERRTIPGASIKDAPSPLLANFGAANEMDYTIDLAVSPSLFKKFICQGAKRRVDDGLA